MAIFRENRHKTNHNDRCFGSFKQTRSISLSAVMTMTARKYNDRNSDTDLFICSWRRKKILDSTFFSRRLPSDISINLDQTIVKKRKIPNSIKCICSICICLYRLVLIIDKAKLAKKCNRFYQATVVFMQSGAVFFDDE